MSDNITVYNITGEIEPRPSGSVRIAASQSLFSSSVLPTYSSSQHEVTRLNTYESGTVEISISSGAWNSNSGRSLSTTQSQYGGDMTIPAPMKKEFYAKSAQDGSGKLRRLIYTLNSSTSSSQYWRLATSNEHITDSTLDPLLGKIVDANSNNIFQALIPVSERGKIRDVKVWVELVHRERSGDVNSGLKGLQISLVSPNMKTGGAYPLWNLSDAQNFVYDNNPVLTGTGGILGDTYRRGYPRIFESGAYVLWDGHNASPATAYATQSNLSGNWHEFDSDIDMRTVFSDSSENDNPRSRIRVFLSASDISPGEASDLHDALLSSTNGLRPINYYYSPSNYAMRNYSGTFSWNGSSVPLSGANIPWYVDSRITPGDLTSIVRGPPPDGWLTGEPNALLRSWKSASTPGDQNFILSTSYAIGNRWGFAQSILPPDTVIILGGYTGSLAAPVSANFVDVLLFNTSSGMLLSASRTGVVSDAVGDGGAKSVRISASMFAVNIGPSYSATFFMSVGGGVAASTLAITESAVSSYPGALATSPTWSAPYSYVYWYDGTSLHYANVRGYTTAKILVPATTASWNDGDLCRVGSPTGPSFIFRTSSVSFLDDQFSGTLTGTASPFTTQSFPRSHPSSGSGDWMNNISTPGGRYWGRHMPASGDSSFLAAQYRDAAIPALDQFVALDTNLTSSIPNYPSTVTIYNISQGTGGVGANLTSSWRNIPNTAMSGNAHGNAFTSLVSDDGTKFVVYSFGGETSAGVNNSRIMWCSASTDVLGTSLAISPWFRQDAAKNSWPGDVAANAFPSPGGTALSIPVAQGVIHGAACVDTDTKTVYFGGGQRQLFTGATSSIYGSDEIHGWEYDGVTGLLTGTSFLAGRMPRGRYKHSMVVANGFVYCVGGMTSTYPVDVPAAAPTSTFYETIDRAFILGDGRLSDWTTIFEAIPSSLTATETGSGVVDGGVSIYPENSLDDSEKKHLRIIGGIKQYVTGATYVTMSSAQANVAEINITGTALRLPNTSKIGDGEWMGPSEGEQLTTGLQLGPATIKPVLPLLDDVYQRLVENTTPIISLPRDRTHTGFRPGLRGTEIFGTWKLQFATTPGTFDPDGDISVAGWAALTASQVYIRQVRLEFLVDSTSGYSDMNFFNPARAQLYRRSAMGLRSGRNLIDIISGTHWWDAGVSYIYANQQSQYGRTVGISSNSSSDDYAVFTQITGALSEYLTGTPDWFLNPPSGEGVAGLPYIPMSSATFGESAQPLGLTGTSADMMRATIDQQLPFLSDNTLPAYLSRARAIRTTQDLFEEELAKGQTGSYF